MHTSWWAAGIAAALFLGMTLSLEIGFRAGAKFGNPEKVSEGVGAIEAAVFALLGLLLGFSFAGGTERLDARRALIVEEANAIGTAYLRVDLLPKAEQPELRKLFREYLGARIGAYSKLSTPAEADREFARAAAIQQRIWTKAVAASDSAGNNSIPLLVLPALNEMIDVTTSRTIALYTTLPGLIFALVVGVALLSGVLAGYAMAKRGERSWMHMLLYAGIVSITIYTVADLDNPRSGLIRLDRADQALTELRDSIQ